MHVLDKFLKVGTGKRNCVFFLKIN
uniref:Uncharacterized protein n=1 Tax=Arundo donax TaxID=35708 RepID=A0A0A9B4X5_ARUDO